MPNSRLKHGPILRDDLFPQHAHKLSTTDTLVRAVLDKQRLCPESETRLAVLADEVERRNGDATTALAPVVTALLDDSAHTLVHLRIDDGDRSLALLELVLVLGAEDVGDESRDGVAAEPEELGLAVVEEVETVGDEVGGSEVEGWRHDDCAGFGVGETSVVGHVVQRVEAGVDVLHEQREG